MDSRHWLSVTPVALLPLLLAFQCYSSNQDLITNASFDQWCDDAPCGWELLSGEVDQTSTWHAADFGVVFVEEGTAIQQVVEHGWSIDQPLRCIRLEVLKDGYSPVTVSLDFLADGTTDWFEIVQSTGWAVTERVVAPPPWFDRVAVTVEQAVPGSSTVGHVRLIVEPEWTCSDTRVPVAVPLGFPCLDDEGCDEGTCTEVQPSLTDPWSRSWVGQLPRTCGSCSDQVPCDGSQVCGVAGVSEGFLERTCELPGEALLGEICAVDDECATGICSNGRCSECSPEHASDTCDCEPRGDLGQSLAAMCATGPRAAGEVCLFDADCASERCTGSDLRVCLTDGRTCSADEDCYDTDTCGATGAVLSGQCD